VSIKSRLVKALSGEPTESLAERAVAGQLNAGEKVVAATIAFAKRPWYERAASDLVHRYGESEQDYFVVLTDRRLLLIERQSSGEAVAGNSLDANRGDVKVERYSDNFTGGWEMTFEELGARWDIHSPADRTKARAIAQTLGWTGDELLGPPGLDP